MHLVFKHTIRIWGLFLLLGTTFPAWTQSHEGHTPLSIDFSMKGGFYDEPLLVELFSLPGTSIFFTVNGDDPAGPAAKRYREALPILKNTVIRAIVRKGREKSAEFSETYFIHEPVSMFPVVSLAIPPSLLFDPVNGLFMKGTNVVDSLWKKPGANFWSRAEVSAHLQYFENGRKDVFNSGVGFRLFGGMSRLFPQKSFAIVTRSRYGEKRIEHPVFGEEGKNKFKFLVFRNSGSDFGKSHFRDALMTGLVEDWDIEKQDYQPCHVYINGHYWGIYNIREKVNRYFIQAHSEFDKDSVDLIEHRHTLKRGSRKHYLAMLKFMETHDLSEKANFDSLAKLMDIDNFMNYQIAQIYFDNQDAGGNIKFWRPQTPDGKWRWILYDTDWGFGLHSPDAYKNNSLAFHTEPNGPSWPNPPWSTFILRKLLENKEFETRFINRFCDYLSTSFHPDTVKERIEIIYSSLRPEMGKHLSRWKLSRLKWEAEVETLNNFADKRPAFVRSFLKERFDTGKEISVELVASAGGELSINDHLTVTEKVFRGTYFENIPVLIKAVPHFGYRFSHWEGINIAGDIRQFYLPALGDTLKIKAIFEKYQHPLAGKVIINEISCNNRLTEDWLEIYNISEKTVHLKDWILTDTKHEFRFPQVTIGPKDYLVVCEDSLKFSRIYKYSYNMVNGLSFGLNKRGERIGLFSSDGAFIDSVGYTLPPTDSVFTLNLLLPWLNNSYSENWEFRYGNGTPGFANPYYVESRIRQRQKTWIEVGSALALVVLALLALTLRRQGIL